MNEPSSSPQVERPLSPGEAIPGNKACYEALAANMQEGFAYCRMLFRNGKPVDFVYLDVNPSFERLTRQKDVLGKKASEVFPGFFDAHPEIFNAYNRTLKSGKPERYENLFTPAGDVWFTVGIYSPQKDHFVIVFDNITERKLAQEAHAQSEERYRALFENIMEGYAHCRMIFREGQPVDYEYLAVNPAFERITGIKNPVGRRISDLFPDYYQTNKRSCDLFGRVVTTGIPVTFESYLHGTRRWYSMMAYRAGEGEFIAFITNVTERKLMEEEQEITIRLLHLLNSAGSMADLLNKVTNFLRDTFGCEAVGIRLRNGDQFPYFETRGFSSEFVRQENDLCFRNPDGEIMRDAEGRPMLQCMCGNILNGRFNPERPYFTKRGSFWTNNAQQQELDEADRPSKVRGRCTGTGYQSIALVALWASGTPCGLIQLNDKRTDQFTPERIGLLERLADNLANAIAHRQGKERLSESEERYREIFNASGEAIFIHDANTGGVLEVNKRMLAMFGIAQEQIPALSINDISEGVSPYSTKEAQEWIQRAVSEGTQFFDWHSRRFNGELFWTEVSLQPTVINGKKRIIAVVRDVTARKKTEEQLRKLYRAVEHSSASIVITDPEGNIDYVNPKFTEVSGYTLEEVRQKNPRILQSGLTPPEVYERLWSTIKQGGEWRGEFQNRRKNGEIYWEVASIAPVLDESGRITHFLAVKEDITERKQLEEQLRQAQKMEAIGTLAGGVAHDFNNLLTIIEVHASMLLETPALSEANLESAQQIRDASERAAALTRQLLIFGRKQVMQPVDMDLNEVVTDLVKMLRRIVGEDVTLETRCAPRLPHIHGDVGMIEQILMNLAANARDAMGNGGRITLATSIGKENFGHGLVPCACLSVTDTGSGIPKEILPHIYEPFFTTKDVGKGTGLGLATVYSIVKQHQGRITVASQQGKGTTFRIFFPCVEATNGRDGAKRQPEHITIPGGKETILVVEDEPLLRATMVGTLKHCGYNILQAGSGKEALEVWKENRDTIHLVLTDMVMPSGMTGRELASILIADRPGLRVLYTTGYSVEMYGEGLHLEEGVNFLHKPFNRQRLAQTIRACLDR